MGARQGLAGAALVSIGLGLWSVPASADGMAPISRPPPYYAAEGAGADYTWTGIYLGGQLGAGLWESNWTFTNPTEQTKQNVAAFTGGGQIGLQKQWDWVVLGAEVAYAWTDLVRTKPSLVNPGTSLTSETTDLLTVSGRLGFTWQNVLAYAKAGYASGNVAYRSSITASGVVTTASSGREDGWVAGLGLEYGITPHITLGVEYNLVELQVGNRTQIATPAGVAGSGIVDAAVDIQTVMARLNFKFGPRPEAVPYK